MFKNIFGFAEIDNTKWLLGKLSIGDYIYFRGYKMVTEF